MEPQKPEFHKLESADSPLQKPQAEPAKLRIYIGAAPGVGKTYRMLEHAHQLRRQGVDIVIGLVETHGRAETAGAQGVV